MRNCDQSSIGIATKFPAIATHQIFTLRILSCLPMTLDITLIISIKIILLERDGYDFLLMS